MESTPSPSLWAQLAALKKALPQTRIYLDDPAYPKNHYDGLTLLGLPRANTLLWLVIAAFVAVLVMAAFNLAGDTPVGPHT